MIRLRCVSTFQVDYFERNKEKIGQLFYAHYDGTTKTLSIRGRLGIITLYILKHDLAYFHARISEILFRLGSGQGTRDMILKQSPAISWLYTMGTHRHVKIAIKPGFRFWPSDIKRLVGIEGTYATP